MQTSLQPGFSPQDLFNLADNISDIICSFQLSPDARLVYINRAIVLLSLYDQEEFYNDPGLFLRIVVPEDRPIVEAMLREGHPLQAEFRMCRRNGQIFGVQGFFNDTYDSVGNIEVNSVHAVLRPIQTNDQAQTVLVNPISVDQRLRRYVEELKVISDIGRTLGESLNMKEIFRRLGQAVHRLFPDVHAQYISHYHPEIEQISCVYAVINGEELDVNEFPAVALDHSPKATQSQAILQREPFIVGDMVAHRGGIQNLGQLVGSGQIPQSALYVPMLSNNNVLGVVQVQSTALNRFTEEDGRLLAVVANAAATVLQNAFIHRELMDAYDHTLEGWGVAIDLRDKETEGHSLRVASMTRQMAVRLGIKGTELTDLWRGALLHDVGKLGVPDSVLLKPGPLDPDEWEQMRKHPQLAYDMIQSISFLKGALEIPYCHHEWWDGNGYPRGLRGDEIPLAARIFAFVDIWDAVTSDRLYRKAWSREKAIEHIQECLGTHLDPNLGQVFLKMLDEEYNPAVEPG